MNNSWIINYLYEMNVNLEILYEMNVNFERVIHFVHFGALVSRTEGIWSLLWFAFAPLSLCRGCCIGGLFNCAKPFCEVRNLFGWDGLPPIRLVTLVIIRLHIGEARLDHVNITLNHVTNVAFKLWHRRSHEPKILPLSLWFPSHKIDMSMSGPRLFLTNHRCFRDVYSWRAWIPT
jgi:hypothetical protein